MIINRDFNIAKKKKQNLVFFPKTLRQKHIILLYIIKYITILIIRVILKKNRLSSLIDYFIILYEYFSSTVNDFICRDQGTHHVLLPCFISYSVMMTLGAFGRLVVQ